MARDIDDQLTKYLTDAHSIEEQALAQLRTAPDLAGDPEIAAAFRTHLAETEGHETATRRMLEERDASPSKLKDVVMAAGGKGFLLFARSQPDTPGKLLAHAISYEALEEASYSLLGEVASRAGETTIADEADRIRGEEHTMLERLLGFADRAVETSLRELSPDDLREQLSSYLADAHAIEEQAIGLLERAPKIVENGPLAAAFEEHLVETREHKELVDGRLQALGGKPSKLKDAAMRLGALNWGTFFQGHPDTPGKLVAFAYAFEHLEIGGYEQLRLVAERAGDEETVRIASEILAQERSAAQRLGSLFPIAAEASLREVGVDTPTH
jgi:ferritin-like metal-binding protein YciE